MLCCSLPSVDRALEISTYLQLVESSAWKCAIPLGEGKAVLLRMEALALSVSKTFRRHSGRALDFAVLESFGLWNAERRLWAVRQISYTR